MRAGNGIEKNTVGRSRAACQIERAGPFAQDRFAFEPSKSIGDQPITLLCPDDQTPVYFVLKEPVGPDREPDQEHARVADQRVAHSAAVEDDGRGPLQPNYPMQ